MKVKSFRYMFLIMLTLIFSYKSFSWEDFVDHKSGYYYVVLENANFDRVNAKLVEKIEQNNWHIIHTLNVDKTINSKTPYKTHLLCSKERLKNGVGYFKPIGLIAPCRIAIYKDGHDVVIMTEDLEEVIQLYKPKNKKAYECIKRVQKEMIQILNATANEFKRKAHIPQY